MIKFIKEKLSTIISIVCLATHLGIYIYISKNLKPDPLYLGYLALLMPLFFFLVYLYDCKYGEFELYDHSYYLSFPITRRYLIKDELSQIFSKFRYYIVFLSGYLFVLFYIRFTKLELLGFSILYILNIIYLSFILLTLRNCNFSSNVGLLANFFYLNFYYSFVPIFLDNLNYGFYSPFGAMYLTPLIYDHFPKNILPIIQIALVLTLYYYLSKRLKSWVANT